MTFSKEFDLLKKFVALANNNPNEHEANVAARRVCKLLEKHNFAFVQQLQQKQQPITYPPYTQPPYQRPPNTPPPAYERPKGHHYDYTIFDEFFKTAGYAEFRQRPRSEDEQTKWYYNRPPKEAKIPDDWIFEPQTDTYFNKKTGIRISALEYHSRKSLKIHTEPGDWNDSNEKRNLKCKTCGHYKTTRFRGPAGLWECMECRGKAYEAKNK